MEIEQQLRLALVPCKPGVALRALVMARVSTAAGRPNRQARSRRVILFGTIAAAAAAAAPLALQYFSKPAPDVAVVPWSAQHMPDAGGAGEFGAVPPRPVEAEAIPPAQEQADAELPPVPPVPAEAVQQAPIPSVAGAQSGVRTVRVLPLENHSTDESSRAAVEQFHASFLEALRTKPGIALVAPDPDGSAGMVADHVLSVRGRGPVPHDAISVVIAEGSREQPNGMFSGLPLVNATGAIAPACAGPEAGAMERERCADPANLGVFMADRVVDRLASQGATSGSRWVRPPVTMAVGSTAGEQYARWIGLVEAGSPLANLIEEAHASRSFPVWDLVQRVMQSYEAMLASPEDLQQGPVLEAQLQQALAASPAMAGITVWPPKCMSSMCMVQWVEPTGAGGVSNTVIDTLANLGGARGRHFSDVRVQARTGAVFLFLDRPVAQGESGIQ